MKLLKSVAKSLLVAAIMGTAFAMTTTNATAATAVQQQQYGTVKGTVVDENGEPVLVGNLLICRNDPETGFEKELTNEDAQLIMRHVVGVSNPKDGKKWKGIHVGNFNDRPKGEIL